MNNSTKIIFKNKLEIKYEINNDEINEIFENSNLLCEINKGITLQVLNKKRLKDDEQKLKNKEPKKKKKNKKENEQNKKQNEKKKLKDEEKKIYKNINDTIEIPNLNDEENKIFNYKDKKKFYLSLEIQKKLGIILENNDLEYEVIERGAFFPLNIYPLENYMIIYYNNNENLILVKYCKSKPGFNFWSINEEKLLKKEDGFDFMNHLNCPKEFFEIYSSYLIKIEDKKGKEEVIFENLELFE